MFQIQIYLFYFIIIEYFKYNFSSIEFHDLVEISRLEYFIILVNYYFNSLVIPQL